MTSEIKQGNTTLTLDKETFFKKKLWLKIFFCGFVELFYLTS